MLSDEQRQRYKRQLGLEGFGEDGQEKLLSSGVLVVGAGGLGSAVILYLAAAGVGRICIADSDALELSNLNRQILHDTSRIGMLKAESARDRATLLNPDVTILPMAQRLNPLNIMDIVARFDVVIDCTDNFHTRYLMNDACVLAGKPFVHGSVFEYEGQASVFAPPKGPCYRCLFPEAPPADICGTPPAVLGSIPGIIGAIEATEVIKLLRGAGEPLTGKLLLFDGLRMRMRELNIARNPKCPVCGDEPSITSIDPARPEYNFAQSC